MKQTKTLQINNLIMKVGLAFKLPGICTEGKIVYVLVPGIFLQ